MAKQKKATDLSKDRAHGGKPSVALPAGYAALLAGLKTRVRGAQLRASVSVNRELILLYWDIGGAIIKAQQSKGYGKQVIERLAGDLQKEFPGVAGFSPLNLWRMRAFYSAYGNQIGILSQAATESLQPKLSQPVTESVARPPEPMASLPWGQNLVLLHKLESNTERLWYAHKAIEHGWSRAVLTHHIETQLHQREGKAVTNFQRTLPPPQSDLAEQTLHSGGCLHSTNSAGGEFDAKSAQLLYRAGQPVNLPPDTLRVFEAYCRMEWRSAHE